MRPAGVKAKIFKIIRIICKKKAQDIVILDIRHLSGFCDYFIICSGDSQRQVNAICEETIKTCKKDRIDIQHCEGDESSRWMLIDFSDVILHIFYEEARKFYNLEYLWSQAKKIPLKSFL